MRLDEFVLVEDRQTALVGDRNDGLAEVTPVPRRRSLLLRAHGEAIDISTIEAADRRNEVSADALRYEADLGAPGRIISRTSIGSHGHPGHAFDATGDHEVLEPGGHFHRSQIDRLEARGAEAVDLLARNTFMPPRRQRGHLRQVSALLADRSYATQNDVVDQLRVQGIALPEVAEQMADQGDGPHFVE